MRGIGVMEKNYLLAEARQLEQAGCFAIVLEMLEEGLASKITKSLKIPTIGCGSGRQCDGRVVVIADLLGLSDWQPGFARPAVNLKPIILKAVRKFCTEPL